MFKKILSVLGLAMLVATPLSAQTTAGPSVIGYWANAPQTNCPIGPCFIQYGASVPITGTFTASLAGFNATAGATANLTDLVNVSQDVALPAGADMSITNKGSVPINFRVQTGAGTAVSTDQSLVPGATVGLHVTTQTHISAIAPTGTSTGATAGQLNIQGGTGLVTGYGGGSSGGGSGGNVTVVGPIGSAVSASSVSVVIASDQAAVAVKQATASNLNATVVQGTASNLKAQVIGAGTAGTADTGVVTVQGIASMTPLLVTPAANSAVNVAQMNGVTVLMGNGATGTGSQRVTLANDSTAIAGWGQGATGSAVPSGAQYKGVNVAGTLRGQTAVNPSGTVYAAQGDITSVNGVTVLTGTGAVGTGAQRVAVGTDTATIAGSAPGTAGSPSTQVISIQGVASGTVVPVSSGVAQASTTSGQSVSPIGIATTSSTPSLTTAQTNMPIGNLQGAQVVLPYSLGDKNVSGLTVAMTGTTSTAVTGIGAPGSGLHNYITQLTCGNSHATVGTFVELQDGSGGTTFYTVPAAAVYGGAAITFPAALRQPTANTALFVKDTTTGANVICSASGYTAT